MGPEVCGRARAYVLPALSLCCARRTTGGVDEIDVISPRFYCCCRLVVAFTVVVGGDGIAVTCHAMCGVRFVSLSRDARATCRRLAFFLWTNTRPQKPRRLKALAVDWRQIVQPMAQVHAVL